VSGPRRKKKKKEARSLSLREKSVNAVKKTERPLPSTERGRIVRGEEKKEGQSSARGKKRGKEGDIGISLMILRGGEKGNHGGVPKRSPVQGKEPRSSSISFGGGGKEGGGPGGGKGESAAGVYRPAPFCGKGGERKGLPGGRPPFLGREEGKIKQRKEGKRGENCLFSWRSYIEKKKRKRK